jgi:hypothetical protein
MIGTTTECLCCGAREGDVNEACSSQKYRGKELVEFTIGPYTTEKIYPLDLKAWRKSEDFKGYLLVPHDLPRIADERRQKIVRAVDAYAATHNRVFIWAWPSVYTAELTNELEKSGYAIRPLPEELVDA